MDHAVRPRLPKGLGEAIGSLVCFIALLGAVVAFSDRMGDHISLEVSGERLVGWGERAGAIANGMLEAAGNQVIDPTPLLVFSVVAVVLVLFMVKA